jgi:hypothetical protein
VGLQVGLLRAFLQAAQQAEHGLKLTHLDQLALQPSYTSTAPVSPVQHLLQRSGPPAMQANPAQHQSTKAHSNHAKHIGVMRSPPGFCGHLWKQNPTGWPHTFHFGKPYCREPEALPHQ